MSVTVDKRLLTGVTAAAATTAAFAKMFLPFHMIGSTAIFVAASAIGAMLIIVCWRQLFEMADKVVEFLLVAGGFYILVIINFLILSRPNVPTTHLLGILVFHALFMLLGFATARALNVLLMMLLGAAAIYLIAILHYAIRFGDLEKHGYLQDIFGFGDPAVFNTFHQNIGFVFGLAVLAAFGLASPRIKKLASFSVLPITLLFLVYISARGALVAVVFSLIFWLSADLWLRSRKLGLIGVVAIVLAVAITSGFFYRYALHNKDVNARAPDAISRTIREIQDPNPGLRLQIWARAWDRVATEPSKLLLGRGIGIYPIDEGSGAPDWLLRPTEGSKNYPHNVHLETLYETGIVGLLLFSILTIMPLVWSLRRWSAFSSVEKAGVATYVFTLVSSELSGAFAYLYLLQFFLAIVVGTIALKRIAEADTFPEATFAPNTNSRTLQLED
jgi:O-antigen ligase